MTVRTNVPELVPEDIDTRARRIAVHPPSVNGHGEGRSFVEEVKMQPMTTRIEKPIDWLWPGYLARGKVAILAGAPGAGKTTIALSLMALLSNGEPWPDHSESQRAASVIWTAEDGIDDTIKPRLRVMGADMSRISVITDTHRADHAGEKVTRPFDPSTDLDLLEMTLHAARKAGVDIRLLVFDPIMLAVSGDTNNAGDVRRGLAPLVQMAERANAAILGITHFAKNSAGATPAERVLGSQAFVAVSRLTLFAAKKEDTPDGILARGKSNIGADRDGVAYRISHEEGIGRIEWRGTVSGTARELLGQLAPDEDEGPLADAKGFLLSLLENGPLPTIAIQKEAKGAGHAWRTLERAKATLKIESRKIGGGWQWALPSTPPEN